jgi:hypothetical protein
VHAVSVSGLKHNPAEALISLSSATQSQRPESQKAPGPPAPPRGHGSCRRSGPPAPRDCGAESDGGEKKGPWAVTPHRTRSLARARQGPVSLIRQAASAAPRHCASSVKPANGQVSTLDVPPTMESAAAEFTTEIFWKSSGKINGAPSAFVNDI